MATSQALLRIGGGSDDSYATARAGGALTRKPTDCTYAQPEVVAPHELARILAAR